jgi:hypothetical protein
MLDPRDQILAFLAQLMIHRTLSRQFFQNEHCSDRRIIAATPAGDHCERRVKAGGCIRELGEGHYGWRGLSGASQARRDLFSGSTKQQLEVDFTDSKRGPVR